MGDIKRFHSWISFLLLNRSGAKFSTPYSTSLLRGCRENVYFERWRGIGGCGEKNVHECKLILYCLHLLTKHWNDQPIKRSSYWAKHNHTSKLIYNETARAQLAIGHWFLTCILILFKTRPSAKFFIRKLFLLICLFSCNQARFNMKSSALRLVLIRSRKVRRKRLLSAGLCL